MAEVPSILDMPRGHDDATPLYEAVARGRAGASQPNLALFSALIESPVATASDLLICQADLEHLARLQRQGAYGLYVRVCTRLKQQPTLPPPMRVRAPPQGPVRPLEMLARSAQNVIGSGMHQTREALPPTPSPMRADRVYVDAPRLSGPVVEELDSLLGTARIGPDRLRPNALGAEVASIWWIAYWYRDHQ